MLFSLQGLGDSKPSELMDRMLDLLGEHRPDFLFVQLFLRQLPSQVRAALANTAITDCRALAEEADRFFLAVQHPGMTAAALHPAYAIATNSAQVHHTAAPLPGDSALTAVATVSHRQRSDTSLCFYHAKFGSRAKKCLPPCSFRGTGNARAGAQ